MDLFFFDTTGAQLLDSWQQVSPLEGQPVAGVSRSGPRRVVALSGLSSTPETWYGIRGYPDLCKLSFHLEKETPSAPLQYGECMVEDGSSREALLPLHPLLVHIHLRSVSCDFRTRPYEGLTFFNNRLFLTYAGAECRPLGAGDAPEPFFLLNTGALDSVAVRRLPHPEMLWQEGCGEIGRPRIYPERDFYCYPGSRTCLVLEGRVGDETCYYPLPLRDLKPGCSYQLDLTLTRKGAPDPDMPLEDGAVAVESLCVPWDLADTQTVTFTLSAGEDAATRTSLPDANRISDWNLLIFNAFGDLEEQIYVPSPVQGSFTHRTRLLRGVPYTILAAGNMGYRLPVRNLSEARVYRFYLARPDDYRSGVPMAAVLEGVLVTEKMDIRLERLMARIDLRMDRRVLDGNALVKVREVSVGNCPSSVTLFPGSGVETASQAFRQGFVLKDGEVEALNRDIPDALSGTVSLYLLENVSELHPSILEIRADFHYEDFHTDPGEPLVYRVPLGEVRRNTVYPFVVACE